MGLCRWTTKKVIQKKNEAEGLNGILERFYFKLLFDDIYVLALIHKVLMKKSDEPIRLSNNSYMKFVAIGNVILVTVFSFAFFLPDVPKWFFALLLILLSPSIYSSLSSITSFVYPDIFYNERSCVMAKFSKKNAVDYKNIIYVITVKQNFFIRLYREYSWNFLPVLRIGYLDENGIEKSVDFYCKHPLKNAKLNKFIGNCKKHNNHFTADIF